MRHPDLLRAAALALLLLPALALAADDFDGHVASANQAFKEERYEDARRALAAAYALRQIPELLPNMGTSLLRLGRYSEAISYYELYLRVSKNPSPKVRRSVEERLAEAQARLRAQEAEALQREQDQADALRREQEHRRGLEADRQRLLRETEEARQRLLAQQAQQPPPLLRRPWFWLTLGGIAAAGATAGVLGWYYSDPLRGWQVQPITFSLQRAQGKAGAAP